MTPRHIDNHGHIGARRGRAGRPSPSDTQADDGSAVTLRTRSRILEVAERLYRRIGHRKATVIDIGREISMSPTNCYRFFRSKQEIKEAVVANLLEQVIVAAVDAARSAISAPVRLQAFLQEVERLHTNRFTQDRSLHDLVVTAMRENWTGVLPYSERLKSVVTQVIAEGQAHGEFRNGDAIAATHCVLAATDFCTNPLLIGAGASHTRPRSDQMLDFCVRRLLEA